MYARKLVYREVEGVSSTLLRAWKSGDAYHLHEAPSSVQTIRLNQLCRQLGNLRHYNRLPSSYTESGNCLRGVIIVHNSYATLLDALPCLSYLLDPRSILGSRARVLATPCLCV